MTTNPVSTAPLVLDPWDRLTHKLIRRGSRAQVSIDPCQDAESESELLLLTLNLDMNILWEQNRFVYHSTQPRDPKVT